MTIHRNGTEYEFECDNCGEGLETGVVTWDEALACLKDNGWTWKRSPKEVRKVPTYNHYCSDCKEGRDDE